MCQAPALSSYAHLLPEDTAIVFLIRPIEDIVRSEKRIGWRDGDRMLSRYFRDQGCISEVKYQIWGKYQKKLIPHAYDIEYNYLKNHPLWENNRKNFNSRQTERGKDG